MAMLNKKETVHLEIQTSRKSPVGIIRTSYYEDGQTRHRQLGRITHKTLNELKIIQMAFRNKVVPMDSPDAFSITQSKEYGASKALLELSGTIGLTKILSGTLGEKYKSVLAMIIGMLTYSGSKLSLCNIADFSSVWDLCGIKSPDVDKHCYEVLDRLFDKQKKIQKKLAKKHLSNGSLILYDITSSYFEGEYSDSHMVTYGYNRDKKSGHKQVVIGLVTTADGCPVGVEVYNGNTKDETTVIDKIKQIKNDYGINNIIFVGDRGMINKCNIERIRQEEDVRFIGALSRNQMQELCDKQAIQLDLFDEKNICEVTDPDNPLIRYCLCKNPLNAQRDEETRERLVFLTQEALKKISDYKQKTTVEKLGARVGKALDKYKVGKLFNWCVIADEELAGNETKSTNHKLVWELNEDRIEREKRLDGCYTITTDVAKSELSAEETVSSYRKLAFVEKAFRNLKTASLNIRPIYHRKDERIKSHVFLCMLAYYVQWHLQERMKEFLEINNKNGNQRKYTLEYIIETLKSITRNRVSIKGAEFYQVTKSNDLQSEILQCLGVQFSHADPNL